MRIREGPEFHQNKNEGRQFCVSAPTGRGCVPCLLKPAHYNQPRMTINISATSALVLNWTDPETWQTHQAADYMRKLDLADGQPLLDLFSEEENFMHTQTISGRKYFMKSKVFAFLDQLQQQGRKGQVLILAAGIAPMSVEVAARFPSSMVFDVDKYNIREKQNLIGGQPGNIRFCECDITNPAELDKALAREGFRAGEPTIAILEGIIYYLSPADLGNLLNYLCGLNAVVAGEFCLHPDQVNEKTRCFPANVFSMIKEHAKLDFITFHSDETIKELFREAGFASVSLTNLQQIQKQRTGNEHPFILPDMCWIRALFAV